MKLGPVWLPPKDEMVPLSKRTTLNSLALSAFLPDTVKGFFDALSILFAKNMTRHHPSVPQMILTFPLSKYTAISMLNRGHRLAILKVPELTVIGDRSSYLERVSASGSLKFKSARTCELGFGQAPSHS